MLKAWRCLLPIALLIPACGDADPALDRPLDSQPALEVGGALLWVDSTRARLDVVATDGQTARAETLAYADTPSLRIVTPDAKHALLLDIARRHLGIASAKDVRTVALASPFSALAVAADSSVVATWHGQNNVSDALVNPAEVALIDLAGTAPPRLATITGLSRQAIAAHVSPPLDVAGAPHRLVWLESPSMLGLADFGPQGVRTAVVPLTATDNAAQVTPRASVARPVPGGVGLYVIAQGVGDVLHLSIDLSGPAIAVSIDQVAAGANPAALHVFEQASGGLRVLTVNAGSADLALLDPSTGTGFRLDLEFSASQILPFQGEDGKPRAVLWQPNVARLWIADLDDLAKKKGKALHSVKSDQPIEDVQASGGRLLLRHPSATAGLSIYNAATGQVTVFQGTGRIVQRGIVVIGTIAFVLGMVDTGSRISRIDLADLHGTSVTVGREPAGLVRLGSQGIAVLSAGLGGQAVAAFPSGSLASNKSQFLEGFALSDLYGGVR